MSDYDEIIESWEEGLEVKERNKTKTIIILAVTLLFVFFLLMTSYYFLVQKPKLIVISPDNYYVNSEFSIRLEAEVNDDGDYRYYLDSSDLICYKHYTYNAASILEQDEWSDYYSYDTQDFYFDVNNSQTFDTGDINAKLEVKLNSDGEYEIFWTEKIV